MRRVYQVTGLGILTASAWAAFVAHTEFKYYTKYGPGPGFFPFWLSVLLGAMALIWILQVSLRPSEPMADNFIPKGEMGLKIVVILVGIAAFALLAGILGFSAMMFVFLLVVSTVLNRRKPVVNLVVAVLSSWAMTFFFRNTLDVQLPLSGIEILRNLGL